MEEALFSLALAATVYAALVAALVIGHYALAHGWPTWLKVAAAMTPGLITLGVIAALIACTK